MLGILHIDSSARSAHPEGMRPSVTRALSAQLVHEIRLAAPDAAVTYRDLDAEGLPFVGPAWIRAVFEPPTPDDTFPLAHSERLIAEVEAADIIVMGVPMYNFSVPASFKAWIDQIVRVGRTFHYTPEGPKGLLSNKRAVIIRSSGTNPEILAAAGCDFHTPYLRTILGFIGITDVDVIQTHGDDPVTIAAAQLAAAPQISSIATTLAGSTATTQATEPARPLTTA